MPGIPVATKRDIRWRTPQRLVTGEFSSAIVPRLSLFFRDPRVTVEVQAQLSAMVRA